MTTQAGFGNIMATATPDRQANPAPAPAPADAMGRGGIALSMLLLLCFALAAFLPGTAAIPPIDRDEARFAQSSKQMLESGDFITPHFREELRAKKPVGIYWMQAASAHVFGRDTIAAYRLPSVIGAVIVTLGGFLLAMQFIAPPHAFIAAMFMASSLVLVGEAHLAKTDAMLCAAILIQQFALWRMLRAGRRGRHVAATLAIIFWGAMGAGILIKGPIAPVIAAGTIAAVVITARRQGERRACLAALRPVIGFITLAAMVLPWVLLVTDATDGAFIARAVETDLLGKIESGQESHGAPPLTHLAMLVATLWPGSLLLIRCVPAIWQGRAREGMAFLLGWILPFWILIELTPTKLPHYFLPVMPALAILLTSGIHHYSALTKSAVTQSAAAETVRRRRWHRITNLRWQGVLILLWDAVFVLASIALGAGVLYAASAFGGARGWGGVAFGLALAVAVLAVLWIRFRNVLVLLAMLVAGCMFHAATFGRVIPSLADIHIAPRIGAAIAELDGDIEGIAAAGYHEPSLVFTLGTETLLFGPADTAFFLGEAPRGVALVERRDRPEFLAAAGAAGIDLVLETAVGGFNISRGEKVEIDIFRRASPTQTSPTGNLTAPAPAE